jgi:hypothetical protein
VQLIQTLWDDSPKMVVEKALVKYFIAKRIVIHKIVALSYSISYSEAEEFVVGIKLNLFSTKMYILCNGISLLAHASFDWL